MTTKTTLFERFKKLGFGFKKLDPHLQLIANEKQEIQKKVDQYIEGRMVELVLNYIDSGYELMPYQKKEFFKAILELTPQEARSVFNRVLERNVKISDETLEYSFFVLSSNLERRYSDNSLNSVSVIYSNKFDNDPSFTRKLFNKWVVNLNNLVILEEQRKGEFLRSKRRYEEPGEAMDKEILWPFEYFGQVLLRNRTLDEYSIVMNKVNSLVGLYTAEGYRAEQHLKRFKSMLNKIETYASSTCHKEIESEKKKISVLYDGGQLDKLIAEENLKLVNEAHVKNLPNKAKDVLEQIKVDYLSLNKKLDDLTQEERFNIENLWSKRIPEIINKYLCVSPEFRETMKNNKGESIEDLLIDSLKNIHDVLNKIQENHSQVMLNDMTVIKQYTKALR